MARLVVFCLGFTVLSQCFLFIQCTDKIFITDVVDGKIFVGDNSGFDFHGGDIREIPLSGVDAPIGIDYDHRTDKIYWSDENERTINRASLDGSNQEILIDRRQGIGFPQGIVLDLMTNRIFWTDTLLRRIMTASLLGSNQRSIISTGLILPWGITLSQKRGKLYWTDQGLSAGKIEMSNKDGTDRRELITARLKEPRGLVLDSKEQRLYWTESHYDVIESIDLDDLSNRIDHVYASVANGDLVVFGISLFFTSIYFTDFTSRGLYEADIARGEIRVITGFTAGAPTHVKIYTDLTCADPCPGNSRCQLVTYDTFECTCVYGWTGLNCNSRIACTLPNPPPMASFVNPSDSYSASTTVTVSCDNGNDQVEWFCNGYTGSWDEEPIDCSVQFSDLTCQDYCPDNSRCQVVANNTPECICIVGWTGFNCLSRITCTLPNPQPMASFVNPSDSYTPNTTLTVTCDNGNDQVEWICNGYTGSWDKEPIDCSVQSSDPPIPLYAGLGGGAVVFVLLLCACLIWMKCKPQRSSIAAPVQPAAPPLSAVSTAGAQPCVLRVPFATSSVTQTSTYHPGQSDSEYDIPITPSNSYMNPQN